MMRAKCVGFYTIYEYRERACVVRVCTCHKYSLYLYHGTVSCLANMLLGQMSRSLRLLEPFSWDVCVLSVTLSC